MAVKGVDVLGSKMDRGRKAVKILRSSLICSIDLSPTASAPPLILLSLSLFLLTFCIQKNIFLILISQEENFSKYY
jgi:hypothetical protein